MYLISRRKRMTAVLVVLLSIPLVAAQAYAHGGGHGGGGGSHGGGGHGGGHASGGRLRRWRWGSPRRRLFRRWLPFALVISFGAGSSAAGATPTHLVVDSLGSPEDLPEARIHRFLQQHLPHPHWVHWFHG